MEKDFFRRWYVTGAATIFRRELYESSVPFSDICVHDAWMEMNAALRNGIVAEPEKLILYRQHTSNQIGILSSIEARIRN